MDGVVPLRRKVLVGLVSLAAAVLWPTDRATSAPANCGAPWDAPGFETPARADVVPDMVCMDLQLAQDKAQAAGFYRLRVDDASGRRRRQVNDQDWVVVSQRPASGTRTSNARVVLRVLAYGDRGAPPVPDRSRPGRMPRLACFDLQEARDTLQSAGFYDTSSRDASGRRRRQFRDRNWIVTDQTPRPGGRHRKTTPVTLHVVKDGEPSPC